MSVDTILLLENSIATESALLASLRKVGHVLRARSILEASVQILHFRPDIIVCEWRLSDGTALEAVREFCGQDVDAPTIVVARDAPLERVVVTIRAGAFDYVVQPFSDERMLGAIRGAAAARKNGNGQSVSERPTKTAIALPVSVGMTWREIERVAIERTLEHCGNSVPEAARMLRLSASTIYRKLDKGR